MIVVALEFGESLEEALAREMEEETGLRAEVGGLLYAATFLTGPRRSTRTTKAVPRDGLLILTAGIPAV